MEMINEVFGVFSVGGTKIQHLKYETLQIYTFDILELFVKKIILFPFSLSVMMVSFALGTNSLSFHTTPSRSIITVFTSLLIVFFSIGRATPV